MSFFQTFYQQIAANRLYPWLEYLPKPLNAREQDWKQGAHRNLLGLYKHLPQIHPEFVELQNAVHIGEATEVTEAQQELIYQLLYKLKPWRKGPFNIFGLEIDTEWRSDWKWDRLKAQISPLSGRYVLDIGCGNGYHLWRMQGSGAAFVVGIDPMPLFFAQYLTLQHFLPDKPVFMLPLGIDELPEAPLFDTVFSMGVLYHRRSPIDFLNQLKAMMVKGGELVLETLVVEGDQHTVLVPHNRYSKMRNVWFIPSVAMLELWLERCGFEDIRLVDLNQTSLQEQRATDWMDWESLSDFLDPHDQSKTVEGYPAPLRAIMIARS